MTSCISGDKNANFRFRHTWRLFIFIDVAMSVSVNGGEKTCYWGGAEAGQFGDELGFRAAGFALIKSIAFAIHLEDVHMMGQSIQ